MARAAPLPPFAAIVVAAGSGTRAGLAIPKQFASWRGKPLLRHSVERLAAMGAAPLIVVISPEHEQQARKALGGVAGVTLTGGGAKRQISVRRGLDALGQATPPHVLIHDAARPVVSHQVVERLLAALQNADGAIPVLPVVDSLAVASAEGEMEGRAEREVLRRVQTPQAFRTPAIRAAHASWDGEADAGDDAQVLHAAGGRVALVEGDESMAKLTFAQDFEEQAMAVRVGSGFDVHRLAEGEELWLCGVRIPHSHGLSGHSDADVALHAAVDALLGALGAGDIGDHFPPSDPRWQGAASSLFVEHARKLVSEAGYRVGNVDLTIICEAPRIGPHREAMRDRLAELLGVDRGAVSVKATTTERLGFTGRGEGIAAQATATLLRED